MNQNQPRHPRQEKKDLINNLRLVILLIYFLFSFPMMVRVMMEISGEWPGIRQTAYAALCFSIFIALEFQEFRRWRYRYENRKIPRTLYFIRILLISSSTIFLASSIRFAVIFTLSPLMVFYTYFAFPFRISLSLFSFILIGSTAGDLLASRQHGEFSLFSFFFLLYRTLIIILFYLLAWFWDHNKRRNDENRQLLKEVRDREVRLKEYAEQVAHTVALEERTRLARDIHDSLGHSLTAIRIQLEKAETFFDRDPETARKALEDSKETARDAMQDIRISLKTLNQEEIPISIEVLLGKLAARLKDTGCRVSTEIQGVQKGYNYAGLMTLYRFIQEGVTNILNHAEASEASLTLTLGSHEAIAVVKDNGRGFVPFDFSSGDSREGVYGLKGLQRRMELVRGVLKIESSPGAGTTLTASVPRDPVRLIGEQS